MGRMKIKDYLNQAFPVNDNAWKNIIFISIFVPVFLFLFQPFGLTTYKGNNELFFIAGFGVVTFIIATFNHLFLPFVFKNIFAEKNWTLGKNIGYMLFTIFLIALGNYIYTGLIYSWHFTLSGIIVFQLVTLMVAIIPVSLISTLRFNALMTKNLKLAKEINLQLSNQKQVKNNQIIRITAENEKDYLETISSDFLYVESCGNYIEINYLEEGKLKTTMLRCTLKRAELSLSVSSCIVKCHRAFYVNLNHILEVKGNSQGYRLCLAFTDKEIPVSRNYSKSIKDLLSSAQN